MHPTQNIPLFGSRNIVGKPSTSPRHTLTCSHVLASMTNDISHIAIAWLTIYPAEYALEPESLAATAEKTLISKPPDCIRVVVVPTVPLHHAEPLIMHAGSLTHLKSKETV